MTTETRAKGGHPPPAARHVLRQRAFQDEEHEWAADIAKVAQHCGTQAQISFVESKLFLQGGQHVATSAMHNPAGHIGALERVAGEHLIDDVYDMFCCEGGHVAGQDVPQHAVPLLEAK